MLTTDSAARLLVTTLGDTPALRPLDLPGDIKFSVLAPAAVIGSFALASAVVALNADLRRSTT